jgi:hypothetical protein
MRGLIELTGFGDLLRLVGILFWVLVIGALIMALTLPKTRTGKVVATLIVVGLFIAFPGRWALEAKQRNTLREAERAVAQARYQKAEAMFQERCKKSGEFIYRTAEDVEGIFLLKIREGTNYRDQYRMDDPYGHDSSAENYIKSFLYGRNEKGSLLIKGPVATKGYRYVDALDPKDGKRYRYTGSIKDVTHTQSFSMGGMARRNSKPWTSFSTKCLRPTPRRVTV